MKASFHVRLALCGAIVMIPAACMAEAFQSTKIKQCSIEYKATSPKPESWPKFWSACAKQHAGDTFLTRKQAKAQAEAPAK